MSSSKSFGVWSSCGVNFESTTIMHPDTGDEIFMFSDAPHLLKLIRNWFIDGGFYLSDGVELNQAYIRHLIKMNTEISAVFKVGLQHLEVQKSERQNVKLASELFSHSVSQALLRYFPNDVVATKLSQFIGLVNNWFDIMNSYSMNGVCYKKPYGLDLVEQDKVLDDMYDTMKTLKCFNKKKEMLNSHQVFQKGVMMSITSLKGLRNQMEKKFGHTFLLTHRVNQDCLENFFSQMRFRNGPNDHPTALDCLYNAKAIILGKNPGISASMHCNTVERDPEEYASASFQKHVESPLDSPLESCPIETEEYLDEISEIISEALDYNSDDGPEEFIDDDPIFSNDETNYGDDELDKSDENYFQNTQKEEVIELHIEILQHDDLLLNEITDEFLNDLSSEMTLPEKKANLSEDDLEYIAGWISWKLNRSNEEFSASRRESLPSHLSDHSYAKKCIMSESWIDCVSHGGLTKPTTQVYQWVQSLEAQFLHVHAETFSFRHNILQKLKEYLKQQCADVPGKIVDLFARSRIYMRCKFLNKKRLEEAMINRKVRKEARLLRKRKGDMSEDIARSTTKKLKKILT